MNPHTYTPAPPVELDSWLETETLLTGEIVTWVCNETLTPAGDVLDGPGLKLRVERQPASESDRAALYREFDLLRKNVIARPAPYREFTLAG